jgi:diguanylate cyclase (GGDEF)-like protein
MNVKTTDADRLRLRLFFAGAAAFSITMLLALVHAMTSGAGSDFIAGVALSLFACGGVVGLLALWIWQPIAEATALATRFAKGETDLRLDASRGVASFRRLATILNGIADHIDDRETRFRLISEATGDAVWRWTPATDELVWHGKWQAVFGGSGETWTTNLDAWCERIHPDDRESIVASFHAAMGGIGRTWSEEYRLLIADGSYRWYWDRAVILRDETQTAIAVLGCMTDIGRQRAAEERIWNLAHRDELTGLPNRALFQSRIDAMMESEADRKGALLLLDIDHFKEVNDTLGHASGDALLVCLAKRLRTCVPESGIICRLGGDEFAVLLPSADAKMAGAAAERILAVVREPLDGEADVIRPRATIGIALIPEHGATPSEIMKSADIALYKGKTEGRDRIAVFDPGLRAAIQARSDLIRDVRDGLERNEFQPWYQPIVSIADGSVRAVEALMRWNHPALGTLPPARFLATLEDAEVALSFGRALMAQVLADYRGWMDAGLAPDYIAVNVSAAGLRLPDFAERILTRLEQAGVPFSSFALEVTETVLFGTGSTNVERSLAGVHSAGVRIALDDFGTGYASLTHLRQVPVDIIKIDQSFVRSIVTDRGSQAIVSAVLELGRGLGKTVVAEGVETEEHALMLRAAGCVEAQGYHYARPMPEKDLRRYLADRSARPGGVEGLLPSGALS